LVANHGERPHAEQQAGGEERLADRGGPRALAAGGEGLEAVAKALEPVLDAQRLARDPAEQHPAEDEERVRVAPGQRELDADHERHEPEPGEHPVLQALGEAGAEQRPHEGPEEDRPDVDEGARHAAETLRGGAAGRVAGCAAR